MKVPIVPYEKCEALIDHSGMGVTLQAKSLEREQRISEELTRGELCAVHFELAIDALKARGWVTPCFNEDGAGAELLEIDSLERYKEVYKQYNKEDLDFVEFRIDRLEFHIKNQMMKIDYAYAEYRKAREQCSRADSEMYEIAKKTREQAMLKWTKEKDEYYRLDTKWVQLTEHRFQELNDSDRDAVNHHNRDCATHRLLTAMLHDLVQDSSESINNSSADASVGEDINARSVDEPSGSAEPLGGEGEEGYSSDSGPAGHVGESVFDTAEDGVEVEDRQSGMGRYAADAASAASAAEADVVVEAVDVCRGCTDDAVRVNVEEEPAAVVVPPFPPDPVERVCESATEQAVEEEYLSELKLIIHSVAAASEVGKLCSVQVATIEVSGAVDYRDEVITRVWEPGSYHTASDVGASSGTQLWDPGENYLVNTEIADECSQVCEHDLSYDERNEEMIQGVQEADHKSRQWDQCATILQWAVRSLSMRVCRWREFVGGALREVWDPGINLSNMVLF